MWNHAQGCRRWFGVVRDTVTYRIERSYTLNRTGINLATDSDSTTEAGAEAGTETGAGKGS